MKKFIILLSFLLVLSGCKTPDEKLMEFVKEDFIIKYMDSFINNIKIEINKKIQNEILPPDQDIEKTIENILKTIPNKYIKNIPSTDTIKEQVKKLDQELKNNEGLEQTLLKNLEL